MDAVAFSGKGVIEAARGFVRVTVDLREPGDDTGLFRIMRQNGVDGEAARVLFLCPHGKVLGEISYPSPRAMEAQMREMLVRCSPERRMGNVLQDAPEDVKSWVVKRARDLGDEDPEVRLRATEELRQLRLALEEALGHAASSDVPEVRDRARQILGGDPARARVEEERIKALRAEEEKKADEAKEHP